MKVNGLSELKSAKVAVNKYGQMVQCMKVGLRTIKLMARVDSSTPMETSTTDSG